MGGHHYRRTIRIIIGSIIFLLSLSNYSLALDFFVDKTLGNDANTGLTWATAKASIQAGINLAASNGGGKVNVAAQT